MFCIGCIGRGRGKDVHGEEIYFGNVSNGELEMGRELVFGWMKGKR